MLYIFMADGFEEVEAVATIDVIRRSGIEVLTVSVGGEPAVKGAHGMTFVCDKTIEEVSPSDELEGVILPGGMPGTLNLQKSKEVNSFIDLCAAPMILGRKGLLQGRRAVCFPGFEDDLIEPYSTAALSAPTAISSPPKEWAVPLISDLR